LDYRLLVHAPRRRSFRLTHELSQQIANASYGANLAVVLKGRCYEIAASRGCPKAHSGSRVERLRFVHLTKQHAIRAAARSSTLAERPVAEMAQVVTTKGTPPTVTICAFLGSFFFASPAAGSVLPRVVGLCGAGERAVFAVDGSLGGEKEDGSGARYTLQPARSRTASYIAA
jgi:hypothetical protein